jgi:hypothetical protein
MESYLELEEAVTSRVEVELRALPLLVQLIHFLVQVLVERAELEQLVQLMAVAVVEAALLWPVMLMVLMVERVELVVHLVPMVERHRLLQRLSPVLVGAVAEVAAVAV